MFIAIVVATAAEAGESSSGCWVSAAKLDDADDISSGVGLGDIPVLCRAWMRMLRAPCAWRRSDNVMPQVAPT